MLQSHRNARNKTCSLSHPLKQNIAPCLQYALRLFGCMVFFQNLVSPKHNQLHYMLTIQVSYKLQQILFTMIEQSIQRLIVTPPKKPMIVALSLSTYVQIADVFTKALARQHHNFLVSKLMLVDLPASI